MDAALYRNHRQHSDSTLYRNERQHLKSIAYRNQRKYSEGILYRNHSKFNSWQSFHSLVGFNSLSDLSNWDVLALFDTVPPSGNCIKQHLLDSTVVYIFGGKSWVFLSSVKEWFQPEDEQREIFFLSH